MSARWSVVAGDAHDARLVEQVHPPAWRNPSPAPVYDLVVLGAGTAGLVTAAGAAGLGARVALVERALMGGDCLVTGCVPSKAILASARAAADARGASALGVSAAGVRADFGAVMSRMRALRAGIARHDSAARFSSLGVDVFLGSARFTGEREVDVEGARLRFRRAVVATGARPAVPDLPGLRASSPLTSENVFALTALPGRLAVLGAGPIGCELAQAFARLGSEVTVVGSTERPLPRDDRDAGERVRRALEGDGVRLALGRRAVEASRQQDGRVRVRLDDGSVVEADAILVATGRAPNVEDLGLDAAGVRADRDGVVVDDHLVTTNPRVLACGDVCSRWKFTHAADAMARVVVQNAFFPVKRRASSLVIPWCTYTDPEVAHVGMGEEEAARRADVLDLRVAAEDVDREVTEGESGGWLRVFAERRRGRILGATWVGRHAGENLAAVVLAMTSNLTLAQVDATIHAYPTRADAFRRIAAAWRRTRLTPFAARVLKAWIRRR